ncbi:hypothetical protein J7J62_08670 [bacterium]|nr:hypothetical protein [bacterium]
MRAKIGNRRGVAMLTVIMVVIFMMIIVGISIHLLVKGVKVTGSSRRYLTTFEAAESGLEIGFAKIEEAVMQAQDISVVPLNVAGKSVTVTVEQLFSGVVSGANIAFGGTGYEGIGTGISSGGSAVFYRLQSTATGPKKEKTTLETVYRKIVGIRAR